MVQLNQERERILHLKSRWVNPMASEVRFNAHIIQAQRTADQLSGYAPAPTFFWCHMTLGTEHSLSYHFSDGTPTECDIRDSVVENGVVEEESIRGYLLDPPPALDVDQILLADALLSEYDKELEDDPESAEDTSTFVVRESDVYFEWEMPVSVYLSRRIVL